MEEDYLYVDPTLENQKYVCLSILTINSIKNVEGEVVPVETKIGVKPDTPVKYNLSRGIKIRGVYKTIEEAEKRCEQIRKFDSNFNVYVGEVGKWLPWDDDPEKADDANYAEPKLNELMKNYK